MRVIVNGQPVQEVTTSSLLSLVETLGYDLRQIAVAVNGTCVPRSQIAAASVKEGDEVEILSAQAGG